jgi:hypothetical protein
MQDVHLVCKECIDRVLDLLRRFQGEQREHRPGARSAQHQEETKCRRTTTEECKECGKNFFSRNPSNRVIEILGTQGVRGKSKYSKRSRSKEIALFRSAYEVQETDS